eukprot:TRINITY_DN3631_c0_g1_i4.p1 TRINITY_DN3631_c0_g1~~TRINITY_DN3631_c0_g1_i4.p1  ORF type:complete len:238 (-),score=47.65 TRINITY_DN3631_c0_g1_i4:20-733(-)
MASMVFELFFLLHSVGTLSALPFDPAAAFPENVALRAWYSVSLPDGLFFLRGSLHLMMTFYWIVFPALPFLWQQTVAQLAYFAVVFTFDVLSLIGAVFIWRKLHLHSHGVTSAERQRVAQQSKRIFWLVVVVAVMIIVWSPVFILRLLPDLSDKTQRLRLLHRFKFVDLVAYSAIDLVLLCGVVLDLWLFILSVEPDAARQTAKAADTRFGPLSRDDAPESSVASSQAVPVPLLELS